MLNLIDHGFGISKLLNFPFNLALYIGMAVNACNELCHDFSFYFLRDKQKKVLRAQIYLISNLTTSQPQLYPL